MKHKIVFKNNGSNYYTEKSPYMPLDKFEGDINEKKYYFWSSDDDYNKVLDNIYEVKEIELPDWLSVNEYLRNWVKWNYHFTYIPMDCYCEKWHRKLLSFSIQLKNAIGDLLKVKKFRSNFRQSLREQLENWLNNENNEYNSPFSHNQWQVILRNYPLYKYR